MPLLQPLQEKKTATCKVKVEAILVTSITLNKNEISFAVGSEETLTVDAILPENATDKTYSWSSSDETIATVDENGKVTAKALGTANITASANDGSGVSATCAVNVLKTLAGVLLTEGLEVELNYCIEVFVYKDSFRYVNDEFVGTGSNRLFLEDNYFIIYIFSGGYISIDFYLGSLNFYYPYSDAYEFISITIGDKTFTRSYFF